MKTGCERQMIGIIDYDAGNIKSVEKALAYIGEETIVSRDPEVLLKADKAILPGVGSFGQAMENLHRYNLVPVIKDMVQNIHMCPLEFPETVFRYSADAANSIPYAES